MRLRTYEGVYKVVESSVEGAVLNRAHNVTFNTWLENYSVSEKDDSQSPEQNTTG